MTLEGLEDDPNFWNDMNQDEEEVPVRPIKDLTTSKSEPVLHIVVSLCLNLHHTDNGDETYRKATQKRTVTASRASTDDEHEFCSPKKLANGKYA